MRGASCHRVSGPSARVSGAMLNQVKHLGATKMRVVKNEIIRLRLRNDTTPVVPLRPAVRWALD